MCYTLDFGTRYRGESGGSLSAAIVLKNLGELSFTDLLEGDFKLNASSFAFTGFDDFTSLAGGTIIGLEIGLDTSTLGVFSDTITLSPTSRNDSGSWNHQGDITLVLRGTITEQGATVPEPLTCPLLGIGLAGFGAMRRRVGRQHLISNHVVGGVEGVFGTHPSLVFRVSSVRDAKAQTSGRDPAGLCDQEVSSPAAVF